MKNKSCIYMTECVKNQLYLYIYIYMIECAKTELCIYI